MKWVSQRWRSTSGTTSRTRRNSRLLRGSWSPPLLHCPIRPRSKRPSAPSRSVYGPEDMALAEELGRRAGIAIENARLYEDAQTAIKRRDDFLSVASHELKTPLTSLELHIGALENAARHDRLAEIPI